MVTLVCSINTLEGVTVHNGLPPKLLASLHGQGWNNMGIGNRHSRLQKNVFLKFTLTKTSKRISWKTSN